MAVGRPDRQEIFCVFGPWPYGLSQGLSQSSSQFISAVSLNEFLKISKRRSNLKVGHKVTYLHRFINTKAPYGYRITLGETKLVQSCCAIAGKV